MTTRKTGKSGASKKRSSANRASSAKPLSAFWRLSIAVALAVFFIAGLYTLAKVDEPSSSPKQSYQHPAVDDASSYPLNEYTFYSLLKNFNIDISDTRSESGSKKEISKTTYLIQAGSFRSEAKASQQRAELILLELSPTIEKTKNSNGEIWYRVILGPYNSRSAMANARTTLISNHFDAMVMTRRG